MDTSQKETNPKDAVGVRKAPISVIPSGVITELGLAMLEGARKYGRHNYRDGGARASVYYDACWRHMAAWWEGEDLDPDSGLSHIIKAIAGLTVLRDAMLLGKVVDDRPPRMPAGWINDMNKKASAIIDKYEEAVAPHMHVEQQCSICADCRVVDGEEICAYCTKRRDTGTMLRYCMANGCEQHAREGMSHCRMHVLAPPAGYNVDGCETVELKPAPTHCIYYACVELAVEDGYCTDHASRRIQPCNIVGCSEPKMWHNLCAKHQPQGS